jgi:hypothetical protein
MESFILFPFVVLRRRVGTLLPPAISILFLVAFLILVGGIREPKALLEKTDYYLGGTLYLSAANLTAYNDVSTNIQIPLIRLGGIAEKTNIGELMGANPPNFLLVFIVLFLGFISYSMVARIVYDFKLNNPSFLGLTGINVATVFLSLMAAFLMIFISSFYWGGLKLLVMINFGIFFTFIIPYAAAGEPLGESVYRGFKFISQNLGRVVATYIGCMGVAIMVPIALLLFTTPLIINLESTTVATLLKIFLGLVSIIFALFYQMVLCSAAIFKE